MEFITTSGIVIGVTKNDNSKITSIDVFTQKYGILHWFNRSALDDSEDYMIDEINVSGDRSTATSANIFKFHILSKNSDILKSNGSYQNATQLVKILRYIVFDGIQLENLFSITKQAIKNFAMNFNPDVVMIKALYLLCREEGYAIDTEWMNSLSASDKILAKQIIYSKFDIIVSAEIQYLAKSLQNWMWSL